GQLFLAWAKVDDRSQPVLCKLFPHVSEAPRRPLFGSPSGAGIKDCEVTDLVIVQAAVNLGFDCGIVRKFNPRHLERMARNGFSKREALLDNVLTAGDHLTAVKHAGRVLARLCKSVNRSRA